MTAKSITSSTKSVAGSTWRVLVFTAIVLGAPLGAMAALAIPVTTGANIALVIAVLSVAGTHVGHVVGNELATKQSATQASLPGLDQSAALKVISGASPTAGLACVNRPPWPADGYELFYRSYGYCSSGG